MSRLARLLLLGAATVCGLAGCGGDSPAKDDMTRSGPPSRGLAKVDGHRMHYDCSGKGSPTIVLEAGAGGSTRDWAQVQPALSKVTRVCSYDRAGLGRSAASAGSRTASAQVDDLHALLGAADVKPPYVLVGHSYGGALVRLYASRFASEVAGAVLVDSMHPDQFRRMTAALPRHRADEDPSVADLRSKLALPAQQLGGTDLKGATAEVVRAGSLGRTPLVVLSHGAAQFPPNLERLWTGLQSELARLSSNSTHVVAALSGHYIQLEAPAIVVEAAREVVAAARGNTPLPRCRQRFAKLDGRCVS